MQEESLETQDPETGHVLTMLTDPFTGGGAMHGASSGIGVAKRLWLFTDRLPFKVSVFPFVRLKSRKKGDGTKSCVRIVRGSCNTYLLWKCIMNSGRKHASDCTVAVVSKPMIRDVLLWCKRLYFLTVVHESQTFCATVAPDVCSEAGVNI